MASKEPARPVNVKAQPSKTAQCGHKFVAGARNGHYARRLRKSERGRTVRKKQTQTKKSPK